MNFLSKVRLKLWLAQPTRFCVSRATTMATPQIVKAHPVVGVVQMTTNNDVEANWLQGKALVERASRLGAKMIFLPECFDYVGSSREESLSLADTEDGLVLSRYRDLAKQLRVWLSLGGMHEKPKKDFDGKRLYNTHFIINASGDICGRYSKTHLFNVDIAGGVRLKETDFTIPGDRIGPPIPTPAGLVGMAICYDVRFPELSTALTHQGAEILTYPSAFTVPTGMAHWEPLLRSRAIENQSYVIAAAQVGKHNEKRSSFGRSMVVDPWGCVVAECSSQVGVCVAEIDSDFLQQRRREMPVESHRRRDLYGHVSVDTAVSIDSQSEYTFGHVNIKASHVFFRTPLSYAFVNLKPVLPGHVLVASVRPAERFSDLSPAEVSDLFLSAQRVSGGVAKHFGGAAAVTVAMQDGADAGQTVKHVHVHVLPRKPGDFEHNNDIYDKLEHHDKEDTRTARCAEQMEAEARELREYFR